MKHESNNGKYEMASVRCPSTDITELKLDQPWPAMAIKQQTAEAAYASVLENAGATLPKRDEMDARIVEETRNGTATYEGPTYKQNTHKNKCITDFRAISISPATCWLGKYRILPCWSHTSLVSSTETAVGTVAQTRDQHFVF